MLQLKPPPTSATKAFVRDLSLNMRRNPAFASAGERKLTYAEPLPLFFLPAKEAVRPDALNCAQLDGWRCLASEETRPLVFGDVEWRPINQDFILTSLLYGEAVNQFATALDIAMDAAERRHDPLELRLLEVPELHLSSVWLHSDENDDMVVVYRTGHAGWKPQMSGARDFIGELNRAAEIHARTVDPGEVGPAAALA